MRSPRFITRVLLLQLLVVAVVTAVFTGILSWVTVQHLRGEAEASALAIARAVASDPEVRRVVAGASEGAAPEVAEEVLRGRAGDVAESTGALFIVITDAEGLRLAHPDPERLREQVSTEFRPVLEGREVVAWETGTLGESARAKVPVRDPEGGEPVGMVSVGFARSGVYASLRGQLAWTAGAATLALLIGALAALVFRGRWERSTLGLQPEELVALVQNQEAVLNGVAEGVVAVDEAGTIRLANDVAVELLGVGELQGRAVTDPALPQPVARLLRPGGQQGRRDHVVVGDRVLYLDCRPVQRDGRVLGWVVVLRDRTDILELTERLDSVRTMTSALRVQRHEFANRIHVAAGLLDAGQVEEAREFLRTLERRGAVDYPLVDADLIDDPFLRSFLGLKSLEAAERGVRMQVGGDTLLLDELRDPEDAATVLGNLLDNAVRAAAPGSGWVEVTLMQSGGDLVLTVADSGPGIGEGVDVFARRPQEGGAVHGHGIGLPLVRELTRRRGGDVWVIDRGGSPGQGAVVGARIPGVLGEGGRVGGESVPGGGGVR